MDTQLRGQARAAPPPAIHASPPPRARPRAASLPAATTATSSAAVRAPPATGAPPAARKPPAANTSGGANGNANSGAIGSARGPQQEQLEGSLDDAAASPERASGGEVIEAHLDQVCNASVQSWHHGANGLGFNLYIYCGSKQTRRCSWRLWLRCRCRGIRIACHLGRVRRLWGCCRRNITLSRRSGRRRATIQNAAGVDADAQFGRKAAYWTD